MNWLTFLVEVREQAKRILLAEMSKIDTSIEELQKKIKSIAIAKKCVKAAHNYLCENLSDFKLAALSQSPVEKKLETFLWFLQNNNAPSDTVAKEALAEFYKFTTSIDEELLQYEDIWRSITIALIQQVKVSRPDIQYLHLGIISEICRNEDYCTLLKQEKGFEVIGKLLRSINDLVNGEGLYFQSIQLIDSACACLTAFATTMENKKYIGELGIVQNLIDLINRTQNEDVLEKAITTIWNMVMCDDNKRLVRECKGIPSICSLLKHSNTAIQENTTIALGYLTRDDENKVAVRECHGLELLIASLDNDNEGVQSKAAGALWNCASNVENKSTLKDLGAIGKLIPLLDSKSESVLENVTGCLWNLAVDNDNKRVIYESGGIPKLVFLISNDNESVVENVTGTLWNCASQAETKVIIRKANGFAPLLKCLNSDNDNIRENAVGALRNCAINDQNKQAIGEMGGIKELLNMLKGANRLSILEKIVSTLWICSIDNGNKKRIKDHQGIPPLAYLLQHESFSIVEKTIGALRNCSTLIESIPDIINANCIPRLMELLHVDSPSIREYAAATLWNCSKMEEARLTIREHGGMDALIPLLSDTHENVLENVTGVLSLLTSDPDTVELIQEMNGLASVAHLVEVSSNEYILENSLVIIKNCSTSSK